MTIIQHNPIFSIDNTLQVSTITLPKTKEFKPKKAGTDTAHVVFILDDSYSMQSCRDQTIAGFNEFLKGQQESKVKTYVSLYKFDGSSVNQVLNHIDVAKVDPLNRDNYDPRGGTNLLDAMGEVMHLINARLKNDRKKDRDSVTVVALTDGEENASRTYNNEIIKGMVETAEGKEWSFMFLGANINAFHSGAAMGFASHNTLQYNTNNMGATMAAASRMTRDVSSLKAAGVSNMVAQSNASYTSEEREKAEK